MIGGPAPRWPARAGGALLALLAVGCGGRDEGAPRRGVSALTAGFAHTCALTAAGGVRCWGANGAGQLGDGATADRSRPAEEDVLGGVAAIAAGDAHTCALLATGGVRCWGLNDSGQLGDGTTTDRLAPPAADVLDGVAAIAAGAAHTCALTRAGGVRCWGANDAGQLGDGTTARRPTPTAVTASAAGVPFGGVRAISAGSAHTCALTAAGGVRCWGRNVLGQLGDGTDVDRAAPPAADALGGVRAISAGTAHTCALTAAGGVRCWGRNADGELGDGSFLGRATPPPADVLAGATAVAAGAAFTCALTAAGGVRCWGYNSDGQLGDDTPIAVDRLSPAPEDVLAGARALAVGFIHTCALMTGGGVRCWGGNVNGQLGDGRAPEPALMPPPVDIAGLM